MNAARFFLALGLTLFALAGEVHALHAGVCS